MESELNKKKLEFITSLTLNEKSKNTIEKYDRDINGFILWCEENEFSEDNADEISKELLIKYKIHLKEKYSKISTINSKISSINSFLEFCNLQNLKIKIIKCQKSLFGNRDRQLNKVEFKKLIDEAYKKKNKRLYYLMQTISGTGIRVSEVKYITVNAIREGKTVVDNKGKVRQIIIPRKLCKILMDYCKNKKIVCGPIFITKNDKPLDRKNVWQEMKDLCKKAGVDNKKVFPHNLRHLFAKEFYKNTKDIVKLASILGHSSIETTRIYTKVDIEECARVLDGLDFIKDIRT